MVFCILTVNFCAPVFAAEERKFRDVVEACQVADVNMHSDKKRYDRESLIQTWHCLSLVDGLIAVMQMNCFERQRDRNSAPASLSVRPTTVGQAIEAILLYARKKPERMKEDGNLTAMTALALERPCEF